MKYEKKYLPPMICWDEGFDEFIKEYPDATTTDKHNFKLGFISGYSICAKMIDEYYQHIRNRKL